MPKGPRGADPEDPDEYRAQNIFWVPPEARWPHLKAKARQPTIGQLVDDAMAGIERDNPAVKSVLPKDYARPALDKERLGQVIDLISNIQVGDEASRVLGAVKGAARRDERPDPSDPGDRDRPPERLTFVFVSFTLNPVASSRRWGVG